jgi:hypothetical protein
MAAVLEECITEEQSSVVRFCGQEDSMQRISINKCFLFTVGSVFRVKRFTTGWQTFLWWRRGWNGGAEVAETTVRRLLCWGFRHSRKAMGQLYQVEDTSRNKCFLQFRISHFFTFYIHLWPIYWLSRVKYKTMDNVQKYWNTIITDL